MIQDLCASMKGMTKRFLMGSYIIFYFSLTNNVHIFVGILVFDHGNKEFNKIILIYGLCIQVIRGARGSFFLPIVKLMS
jgi:hypothetical protein